MLVKLNALVQIDLKQLKRKVIGLIEVVTINLQSSYTVLFFIIVPTNSGIGTICSTGYFAQSIFIDRFFHCAEL